MRGATQDNPADRHVQDEDDERLPTRGDAADLARFVRDAFRPYGRLTALVLLGVLVEVAFNAAFPLAFQRLIDRALLGRDGRELAAILAFLAVGGTLVAMAGVATDFLFIRVLSSVLRDLRLRLFERVQSLSMAFHRRARSGEVLARFSGDLIAVEGTLTSAIPWLVMPCLDVAASSLLLFVLDWRLATGAMLIWPLALLGPFFFAPRAMAASYRKKEQEGDVLSLVQENLLAQPVVKAFGLEPAALGWFRLRNQALFSQTVRVNFLGMLVERSAALAILVLDAAIVGVGALMCYRDWLSVGTLVAFEGLFLALSYGLTYIAQFFPTVAHAAGGVRQIGALLAETPRVVDAPGATPLPRLAERIAFEDVSFSYDGPTPQLDGVRFTIEAGQFVALVGPSGSGKSTVLNLLLRFDDPTSGRVRFDGRDLREATQESLRAQLAVVFQDNLLFHASVRENIRLGRPGATDAEVEAAARAAEVHDDIVEQLPHGYDTVVGERGSQLSGGQRQRIALARALVRDPSVLILDEVTSALDHATATAVLATLKRQARGRTVLFVTHRLRAAAGADQILVFEAGRLVQDGRHADLIAVPGPYRRLWQTRSGRARRRART